MRLITTKYFKFKLYVVRKILNLTAKPFNQILGHYIRVRRQIHSINQYK